MTFLMSVVAKSTSKSVVKAIHEYANKEIMLPVTMESILEFVPLSGQYMNLSI